MSDTGPHPTVDLCRSEVERMMDIGVSFDEVEDAIESADLPQIKKAALWLLAWSLQAPARQRALALEALAFVGP